MRTDQTSDGRQVVRFAVAATAVVLVAVWLDVQGRGNGNPVSLLDPGSRGPSAEVVEADFPDLELPGGVGHDGQQFYAVARDPFPLDRSAPHLDRPWYRLQRPLLPLLAWALHPQGGGVGLVLALLVVGLVGVVAGGIALGTLVRRGGGPVWAAAVLAILPGTFVSLRITTADPLALGLALAALASLDSRRWWPAVPLGIAAVLAREPTLLVLGAVALARRDRRSVVLAGAASAATLVWAIVVRATVPARGDQVIELVPPFTGWWKAAGDWLGGEDLVAAATCVVAIGAGIAALLLRRTNAWAIPILVQLVFLTVLSKSAIGLDYNGTRTVMPVLALSTMALLSRDDSSPVPGERATATASRE